MWVQMHAHTLRFVIHTEGQEGVEQVHKIVQRVQVTRDVPCRAPKLECPDAIRIVVVCHYWCTFCSNLSQTSQTMDEVGKG